MQTVWIYKGLPSSGKSQFATNLVISNPGRYKNICKDDLRAMLDGNKYSKANEKFVLNLRNHIIKEALLEGKHVIVSDTNLNPVHEKDIRDIVNFYNEEMNRKNPVQVKVKFFDVPVEECIEMDLKRPNSVGSKVIRYMHTKWLKPKVTDKEMVDGRLKQDETLPKAIIVDLDGSIALGVNRSPFEYHKCNTDIPNEPVIMVVENYLSYSGNKVIFVSGREDICKEMTREWISKHVACMADEITLHMRKAKDYRKDTIVKQEIFENEIKDKYYVDFILDDRKCVVDMWRSLGLTCLQVAPGDF